VLDHFWGASCGGVGGGVRLPPSKAGGQLLMNLQAVIDDSSDPAEAYVLAGYVASAEAWAEFSREWEELLPLVPLSRSGVRRFKMAQMAASKDRMAHIPAFYRVIERHVLASVSAKINVADLRRVQARILIPGLDIDWGTYANPYFVTFRCLMDMFHIHRHKMTELLPAEQKIDFYFDNQSDKKAIIEMWENYIKERSEEVRKFYGAAPSFREDEEFLPLQAADFWAWWVRKWYQDGIPEKILNWDFDAFEPTRKRKTLRSCREGGGNFGRWRRFRRPC
jgi:hypothetical protein